MTYAELIASLQTWVESSETAMVAELDFIIELAEKKIYRSIDLENGWKYSTEPAVQGTAFIDLPTDSVVIRSVEYIVNATNARTALLQKDVSFIQDYTGDVTVEGTPRYYAHYDDAQILVGPAPDAVASYFAFSHTYRPAQLSSGNTTTWLSLEAPDVLLYACLKELATFLKEEPDIIANYDKMYGEAFQGSLLEENFRNRQDVYRQGEIKVAL
jgi:hypothetical protein